MQRSDIDRRSKRIVARQCISDYGMHKDADPIVVPEPTGRVYKFRPGKRIYRARSIKDQLIALRGSR